MSRCVIVAMGFASGDICNHEGQYLKEFDFDSDGGRGRGEFTKDKMNAKIFSDPGSALRFWKSQSKVRPLRDDGEPNRPLSCLNIGIEHVE